MRASRRLLVAALASVLPLAAGCRPSTESGAGESTATRASNLSDFRISIVQTGGIAGERTVSIADGATLTYTQTGSRICAEGASCPATDSLSGALPERDVRALERLVAERWDSLLEDYGRSEGAADLFEYVIEISYDGRTKRITADDLTLPPELGTIRDRLLQAIDSARGR